MTKLLGPILKLQDVVDGIWHLSVVIVIRGYSDGGDATATRNPPELKVSINGATGTLDTASTELRRREKESIWRYEWEVPQTADQQTVRYEIDGVGQWEFHVPGIGTPLRMAYASCNGYHSASDVKRYVDKQNERWEDLAKEHAAKPYHVLLLGGDQLYADPMWLQVPSLERWLDKRSSQRIKASFTQEMNQQVERFYFDLYCSRWTQDEPAQIFATVPSLMMWDDHDIFDGWGSYDAEMQACDVYHGIYKHASDYFHIFQLQCAPDEHPSGALTPQHGLSYGHVLGDVAILNLDTRSERTQSIVLSPESWEGVFNWIDGLPEVKHLLVLASVPVVYPSFTLEDFVLGVIPGAQDLEDDLRDHWRFRGHREERLRMICRLLSFANRAKNPCRVTIISGDVHVAALGVIESTHNGKPASGANVINQLISSAIVNVPAPGFVRWWLERWAGGTETVTRGIEARMLPFPGVDQRIIAKRNWLSLTCDDTARIWAEWRMEGEDLPHTKVIHPV